MDKQQVVVTLITENPEIFVKLVGGREVLRINDIVIMAQVIKVTTAPTSNTEEKK